jgi:hypothetical protein
VSAASKCAFKKADGTSCKATCLTTSRFCYFHDPDKAPEREAARKRGGRRKKKAAVQPLAGGDGQPLADVPLATVADVVKALASTFNGVRRGGIDPKTGNCLGLLAGQLLRAMQDSELAAEIDALAKEIQELKRANGNAPQTTEDVAGRSDGDPSAGDAGDSTLAG